MKWLCLIILVTWGLDDVNTQSIVGNCTSNPCKNGAECENTTQGYQCYCVDGFAGTNCEINFDDCASTPCFNNATCADDVAAYRCLCQPGFTGEQCQINIDDCTSFPCLKAGTCIDLINGFICACPLPYKGDNCSLLPCDISPCENEGICYNDIDLINTTRGYFCDCVTGFEGLQCEVNIDDCNSTACNGQGVCIDGINDYSCFCAPGFVGEDCQFPVNDCIDNKCRNNATCHDLHLGYWCECLGPGYEGLLCEREKDECTDWKPCQNGGTCVDKFSGYSCHCTDQWGGDNCTEKVNRCQTRNPCLNGAGCVNFNDGFICQCRPFYTGELCETEFNPCAPEYNPCQNEAECIAPQDGQYRCFCAAGFTGENCEVNVNECLSFPCENNGTCEDRIDGYICHCMSGWTGHTCTVNINDCAGDSCLNGAICIDKVNRFDCNCTNGYTGLFCEHIIDYCTSNHCYNGGSCNILPGGFMCDCLPPYTGVQCIDSIDACGSDPCHNNASCVSLSPGYICNCAYPFTGLTCQDRIRYCDSEPCMNDAICREGIEDFFCICPPLLTGKQCTELLDYCKDTPCKNYGICVNGQFTYRCVCAYGFKGENCTDIVDFCLDKPCQNFGNCSNIPGGYKCKCQNQFYGKVCESVAISSLLTYTVLSSYIDSASTNSLQAHSLTSSSLFSYITDTSWLNTSGIISLPVTPSSSFVPHRNITMIRMPSEQSSENILRYLSSEQSSENTLRNVSSEQSSQITLRYMSSEPSSQITSRYMSSEPSSQITLKYMSSEPFSQITLRYMSSEQSSQSTLRYMSSEPSSQITLRYMSSEQSSQSTLRYMSTEPSSKNTLTYMSSEQSSQNTFRYMSSEYPSQKTLRYNSFHSITTFDSMVLSTNMISSYMNVSSSSIVKITPTLSSQFKSILRSIILNDSTVLKTIVKQTIQDKHSIAYSIQFNVTLAISNSSFKSDFSTQVKPTVNLNKSLSTIVQSLTEQTLLGISSYLSPLVTIPSNSLSITSIMSTILTANFTTYLSIDHHRTTHSATSVLSLSHLQESSHYNLSITKTLSSDRRSYKSSSITSPPSNLLDNNSDQGRSSLISKSNILLSDISKLIYMSSMLNSFKSTVSINTLTTGITSMNTTLKTVMVTEKLTDIIRMKTDILHTTSTFSLPSVTSILPTASLISSTMITQLPASDVLTSFIMSKRHASMYTDVSRFRSIFKDTSLNSTIDFLSTIAHKTKVMMNTSLQRYNVAYSKSTSASLTEDTFSYFKIASFTSHTVKPVSETFLESQSFHSSNMTLRLHKSSKGNNVTLTPSFTQSLLSYSSNDKTLPILTKTNQLDTKPGQCSLSESSLQTSSRRYHTTLIVGFHSTSIWSPHSLSTFQDKHLISPIKPTSSYPLFSFDLSSTSFLARNTILETSIESPEPSTNVLSASKKNIAATLITHTSVGNVTSLYQRTSGTQMKSSQIYLGLENKSESFFSLRAISPTIVTRSTMNTEYPYETRLMSNVSSSISKQTWLSQSFTDTSFIYTPYIISASNTFKSQTTTTTRTMGFSSDIPGNRCLSVTCLNGGVCEVRGSAVCVCPERFSGPECKTATTMPLSQFDGNTYLEFRNYNLNGSLSVQVSFNTTQSKGMLLLYQTESSSNRIYLVIDEGVLKCQLDCNGQSFTLDTRHNVNSGSLFTLTVRQAKACEAILELTGAALINQTMKWKFESSQITETDQPTKIILLLIGRSPAHSNVGEQLNFTGCIGNIFINGFPIWTNDSVNEAKLKVFGIIGFYLFKADILNGVWHHYNRHISAGLKADLKACDANMTLNVCQSIACLNGGICQLVANLSPICNCLMPFTGVRCETEILLHYPSLDRTSYLKYSPPSFYSNQSNEVYISVRPIQPDGTIVFSSNENPNNQHKSFIHLFLEAGAFYYMFSCDGHIIGTVDTNVHVTLGDTSEILIRQSWTSGPGQWCNAALILNTTVFMSQPALTIGMSQALGYLYIGGHSIGSGLMTDLLLERTQGYVGCIKDLQVNDVELNIISMAIEGLNIGNCDVPVCQHNPCANGATCHSSGEDWYCECVLGYTGRLCVSRLCANDNCLHGGTCVLLEEQNDYLCLCPYGRGGVLCEEDVTVTRPHFSGVQYGYTSYLAYENIDSMRNDFEVQLNCILDSNSTAQKSLILFLGNTAFNGGGDFIALGLFKDYILFTYNLGSGSVSIWSDFPLDATMSHHNIQFGRRGRDGWLRVDYGETTTGRSPGVLTALDTDGILYVGGTDVSVSGQLKIQTQLEVEFRGCIYDLEIRNGDGDFAAPGSPTGRVDYGRSVGDCSKLSCNKSPCQNGAQCIDLGSSIFCNCTGNWRNVYCTETMTACDVEHECADGATCLPRVPQGYHCLCPLGRRGELCYEEFTISDPMFYGENSYMSFTPVFTKLSMNIKVQLKPSTLDGILFYVAKQLHSYSGDFLSLVLLAGKVQLRYHLGDKLNVLSSSTEIKSDTATWYMVEAGRNITHGFISVDGEMIVAKTTGSMAYLDTTTDFCLGGVPGLSLINPSAVPGEPSAFIGCIREFIVNDKKYQLTKEGASGGCNIQDCDGTNCGYDVCKNNGTCNVISMSPYYNCTCSEQYFGETCDLPIECSNYSCEHGGECKQQISGYYGCSCALGWSGPLCNIGVELGTAMALTRDSYVYYFDPFYEMANETYTNLSIIFRTSELNGLLFWNGQTYSDDEDYLGLGLTAGRIKLVWNLGWYSRSEVLTSIKYNDGHWHSAFIERYSQSLTLTIDGEEFKSRVSGDFFVLDTHGQYFIGSYDEGSVLTRSLGFYKEPFAGCIRNLYINNFEVNFNEVTDGRNIGQC